MIQASSKNSGSDSAGADRQPAMADEVGCGH
jgi:hypothetical protein